MPNDNPDTRHTRTVTTPLEDVTEPAARAASLDPQTTAVVDADVTDAGDLRLELEGERL
ncbi:hypothetical protein [Halorubrum sp. 48-1-W]|uniref:hypothetical protein n=1 Tax=Halorubrum sp. 48-1-W TaxID=2249761 RepID=UPI0013002E89|nr:hypothetical protein [Halorubrum sp. 48-1-W]